MHNCTEGSLVLIYGSARIGEPALIKLAAPLQSLAFGKGITVVGGITYAALGDHPHLLEELKFATVPVPAFAECHFEDRVLVTRALLEADEGNPHFEYPDNFPEEVVDGRPQSRTELEL